MLKKQNLKSKAAAKVTFSLPKKAIHGAKEVRLVGDFNDWKWAKAPILKLVGTNFQTTLELATGKDYQFRYIADNGNWENDWAADDYIPSPMDNVDNSVVSLPATTVKKAVAAKTSKTDKAAKPKKAAAKATKAKKDDLKKIEGIGPKIAGLLNDANIHTFSDLADASIKTLKEVLVDAGKRFQMHDPKTWTAQAKLAAEDQWDKLKKWQEELKGGK